MITRKLTALGILLCLFSSPIIVWAQTDRGVGNRPAGGKRLALVIGNGAYQKTSELANPSNDAADMSATLSALGFEVLSGTNQTKRQMETLIREFGDKLSRQGGVGLFFYAGHGLQIKGNNYLIPVDAEIPAPDEVEYATINLSFLLGKMDAAGNDLNIVILDACRNNPFARSWRNFRDIGEGAGLAKITPPTGTVMLYATQPGNVASDGTGRNGLFTESLLEQIRKPGVELDAMIKQMARDVSERSGKKQMPWKEGIVTADFYFAGGGGGTQTAANPVSIPVPVVNNSRSAEDVMWDTIARINTKLAVEGYLSEYPSGKYAATARLMLKVFEEEQKKAREIEESINAARISVGMEKSNGLGMKFMGVPAGTFQMGSTQSGDEGPVRTVSIGRGFFMGRTEVTQGQWEQVMGTTLRQQRDKAGTSMPLYGEGAEYPMYYVNWEEAKEYIRRLNARNDGYIYSLPTEAEWEYAARARTTGDYGGNGSLDAMGWYTDNSGNTAHPVGQKQPNAFALYDMHGNVWEWCEDIYNDKGYAGLSTDGSANVSVGDSTTRVLRGGSWSNGASRARSALRLRESPSSRYNDVGFRVLARLR